MSKPDRLFALIAQTLRIPLDAITPELNMQDTGSWDSLSHMELIAALEDDYAIELTADEIVAMISVASILEVLRGRGVAG